MISGDTDRLPDPAFRLMAAIMAAKDLLFPSIDRRVDGVGIREGRTIVD